MKILFVVAGLCCVSFFSNAQPKPGDYRGILYREDGKEVVFNMAIKGTGNQTQLYIINATEKIQVRDLNINSDSVTFRMPVFESEFKARVQPDGSLKGIWLKAIAGKTQQWPFVALPGKKRFDAIKGAAKNNISGRWAVTITRPNGTTRLAVAEFVQKGNQLTGTFLTPTGDYRYLQGIVTGDLLLLSTFDGAHAYTFSAKIAGNNKIVEGFFGSGIAGKESWVAEKSAAAKLPESLAPQLKAGYSTLDFTFNDIDGNKVSINDERFKNKVVIIQIMGSWCPNCLDETKFLSDYYDKNQSRGVEVVSLAYEYSTDFQRSQKSVRKFQQLFAIKYPMLITGVAVGDSLRTEKTLPQITPIKAFPTTIFLSRDGTVKEIHSSFYGPGSGKYYEEFKKEFYATVEGLLKES
ncbi:peroxiredoxin family protein [Terrimonas pollutisoli]|uniref:peroxiredoxin family protein n=1 Tax=Terrimonas pollutisoli TaxID=3034147 RepID=UPI0023ED1B28|nr:TlpA disulfide reductase family protein [Terrimonas sp. H1YJ31]